MTHDDGTDASLERENNFFRQWEIDSTPPDGWRYKARIAGLAASAEAALAAGHAEDCQHFYSGTAYNGMDYDVGDVDCTCGAEPEQVPVHCANCGEPAPKGTRPPSSRMVWLCSQCDLDVELTLS